MKILPVGAELFHADGQAGMGKLTEEAFRNFSKALKKIIHQWEYPPSNQLFSNQAYVLLSLSYPISKLFLTLSIIYPISKLLSLYIYIYIYTHTHTHTCRVL